MRFLRFGERRARCVFSASGLVINALKVSGDLSGDSPARPPFERPVLFERKDVIAASLWSRFLSDCVCQILSPSSVSLFRLFTCRCGKYQSTNTLSLCLTRLFRYIYFPWVFLFLTAFFTFNPYIWTQTSVLSTSYIWKTWLVLLCSTDTNTVHRNSFPVLSFFHLSNGLNK